MKKSFITPLIGIIIFGVSMVLLISSTLAVQVKFRGGGIPNGTQNTFIKIRGGGSFNSPGNTLNGFSLQRTITISSSLVAPSGTILFNFPLLVSSTLSDLAASSSGGMVNNASGNDIIFTTDSGCTSTSSWQMETYTSSTGAITAWVNIPSFSSSTGLTLYLCYGKAGLATFQSIASNTWNSNYAFVYHMNESAANKVHVDSTANGNNGNSQRNTNLTATTTVSKIGGISQLYKNASFDHANTTGNVTINSSTFSIWIQSSGGQAGNARIMEANNASTSGSLHYSTNAAQFSYEVSSTLATGGSANNTDWHYIVGTFDGATSTLYVDGDPVQSRTINSSGALTQRIHIGDNRIDNSFFFQGYVEEARVADTARSADWIKTEYNNQNDPSTFETISGSISPSTGAAFFGPYIKVR